MGDAYLMEEGVEALIFATPISLHGDDLSIKQSLN